MTNELRKIIISRISTLQTLYGLTEVGYRQVQDDSLYPHIVVDFTSVTPTDMGREDFLADVHIWTKDNYQAFEIQDAVRNLFKFWNAPAYINNQTIYATFYEESSGQIDDPDKTVCHLVMRFQAQVFNKQDSNSTILWRD